MYWPLIEINNLFDLFLVILGFVIVIGISGYLPKFLKSIFIVALIIGYGIFLYSIAGFIEKGGVEAFLLIVIPCVILLVIAIRYKIKKNKESAIT